MPKDMGSGSPERNTEKDFTAIDNIGGKSHSKMGKGDEPGAGELRQNFPNPYGPNPER